MTSAPLSLLLFKMIHAMFIRAACQDDLPTLDEIYDTAMTQTDAGCDISARPTSEREAWWQAHQDPRFPILVAVEEDQVVGYAALSLWHEGVVYTQTAEASVYLAPDAQGKGLGTLLLNSLLNEAARLDYHVIIARVWAGNTPSLALCRRCGFVTVGVQPEVGRRRGAWDDCVILQYLIARLLVDV